MQEMFIKLDFKNNNQNCLYCKFIRIYILYASFWNV